MCEGHRNTTLDDLKFVVEDYFVWLKRRMFLLLLVTFAGACTPFVLAKQLLNSLIGAGWFSDPRGSAGFMHFTSDFMEYLWCSLTLRPRPASQEAIQASKNPPTRGSGDGIVIQLTDDYVEFQLPPGVGKSGKDLVGPAAMFLCPTVKTLAASASCLQRQVIIIPGPHVSPFAYSPLARALAGKGYATFVLRLPFNLAYYGWATAGAIMKRPRKNGSPDAPTKWVLVGHSMGSMGVNQFTNARPDCVDGVVYMGSAERGLSKDLNIPVLILKGSRDPFTLGQTPQPNRGAELFVVEGGNHRGFASYDRQPLDWEATIEPAEQRRIVVEALSDFIERRVVRP